MTGERPRLARHLGLAQTTAIALGHAPAPGPRLYRRGVPILGAASCVLLALSLPWQTIVVVGGVAAAGKRGGG